MNDIICYVENVEDITCNVENGVYIEQPNLQEKEVVPNKQIQIIEPDKGYNGLSKVTVDAYTAITDKKIITENGIYNAGDDNLDGYNQVEVKTSGVNIDDYFKATIQGGNMYGVSGWSQTFLKFRSPLIVEGTNASKLLYQYPLEELPELLETDKITNMSGMFSGSRLIKTIPNINTSNVTDMSEMFYGCILLETLPKLNTCKVERINSIFTNCTKLQNIAGLENIGQAYNITTNANDYYYRLTLSSSNELTHESLMNIINNLYDIKTKGCNPQLLNLGSTNIAKLTSDEVAIATNKGWNVS